MKTLGLDRATCILEWADYSTAVLGNPATGNFELIEFEGEQFSAQCFAAFHARGFHFLGVLGLSGRSGRIETRAAFDEPLEESAVSNMTLSFLRMYLAKRTSGTAC